MDRAAAVEALESIENGMCRVKRSREIWQDELVYALCQAARLLLIDAIRDEKKQKRRGWEFATDRCEVGENCQRMRNAEGLTRKELARRAGVATNTVYLLETGKVSVGLDSLMLIAQALGCAPNDLLAAPQDEEVER